MRSSAAGRWTVNPRWSCEGKAPAYVYGSDGVLGFDWRTGAQDQEEVCEFVSWDLGRPE
jgi:hypothetical protein